MGAYDTMKKCEIIKKRQENYLAVRKALEQEAERKAAEAPKPAAVPAPAAAPAESPGTNSWGLNRPPIRRRRF